MAEESCVRQSHMEKKPFEQRRVGCLQGCGNKPSYCCVLQCFFLLASGFMVIKQYSRVSTAGFQLHSEAVCFRSC